MGPDGGRADDFAMKHTGDPNLLNILESAFCLGRDVDTWDGLSEHFPGGRVVRHGLRVHHEIKALPLDQLAVAHRVGWISAFDREHAILEGELANIDIEVLGRQLEQRVAGGIESVAQAASAELSPCREAASGV